MKGLFFTKPFWTATGANREPTKFDNWHLVLDRRGAPSWGADDVGEPAAVFANERDAEEYIRWRMSLINARVVE